MEKSEREVMEKGGGREGRRREGGREKMEGGREGGRERKEGEGGREGRRGGREEGRREV